MKSLRPRDDGGDGGDRGAGGGRNSDADFRGQRRRNDSHASTTDGGARLYRKGHGRESRHALPSPHRRSLPTSQIPSRKTAKSTNNRMQPTLASHLPAAPD